MSAARWLAAAAGLAAGAWALTRVGVGWADGRLRGVVLLTSVDGHLLPLEAARAWRSLAAAAARDGVQLRLTSGFRTYAEQAALYAQHMAGMRRTPVARPGWSNHQRALPDATGRGPAVDVQVGNSRTSREYRWLANNAQRWGWRNTGATFATPEYWHWEWMGLPDARPSSATALRLIPGGGGGSDGGAADTGLGPDGGWTNPGGNTPPGLSGTPPGQGGTPPGQGGSVPGHGGGNAGGMT